MESIPEPIQLGFDTPHLCECGCGQVTPICNHTDRRRGVVKGRPHRYVHGHWVRLHVVPVANRFWTKVHISEADECWTWQGYKDARGYGVVGDQGQNIRAHRCAYTLHYGPIADGLEVCHTCDNPPCCNPHHLFLGTHSDNMRDMVAKGRRDFKGEANARSKLTEADVIAIRRQHEMTGETRQIARQFGLGRTTVQRIVARKTWRHVP